jgi:hypothetical protein
MPQALRIHTPLHPKIDSPPDCGDSGRWAFSEDGPPYAVRHGTSWDLHDGIERYEPTEASAPAGSEGGACCSKMPLWRWQRIGAEQLNFQYENQGDVGVIHLLPGIAYCFRKFHAPISDLVQGAWVHYPRQQNLTLIGENRRPARIPVRQQAEQSGHGSAGNARSFSTVGASTAIAGSLGRQRMSTEQPHLQRQF